LNYIHCHVIQSTDHPGMDRGCRIARKSLLSDCSHLCHSWQQCSKSPCTFSSMLWFPWCLLPAWRWNPCPLLQVVPRWFCMVLAPHRPHRRTQLCHKPLPASCVTGNSQPVTAMMCCIADGVVSLSDPQLIVMS
jgi:hypothetical protein